LAGSTPIKPPGTPVKLSEPCRRPKAVPRVVRRGSKRRRTAVQLLARKHQKVRRQRQDFPHQDFPHQDFPHQLALGLPGQYATIYGDELPTATLHKNPHLAKSISDAGWSALECVGVRWSALLSLLSVQAACAGRSVVVVPPAHTSQACSGRGRTVSNGLSVGRRACPEWRTRRRRDHHAAKNSERAGQALRGAVASAAAKNRAASPGLSRESVKGVTGGRISPRPCGGQ
jgi:putative transposase